MKLNFDIKNKKAAIDADVEKIVEKGMDYHEQNWFEKHALKHKNKREMEELKHKQRIEMEEIKYRKETWFERRENAKIRRKQMEQELKIQKDKEDFKQLVKGLLLMLFIIIVLLIICGLGANGFLG